MKSERIPVSKNTSPTRASLRRLLERVLLTDADLEAFCLDFFPEVSKRFASSNDRLQKMSLLLQLVETKQILDRLNEAHPAVVAENREVLAYSGRLPDVERRGKPLVTLGLALAVFVCVAGLVALWHRPAQPVIDKLSIDAGALAKSLSSRVVTDAAEPDSSTTANAAPIELPVLKIFNERQRTDATKLSAPITSVEKFFQNTRDLGDHAELVTHKKIDPAKRQWITHVILVDGRSRRPVSMIIYSEAEFRSWVSDVGSASSGISPGIRVALVNIEKVLSEISSYKVAAETVLQQRTSKKMEDAVYAFRFQNYEAAVRMARGISQDVSETPANRARAWELVALAACEGKWWEAAASALRELGRLNVGLQQHAISVCRNRGMR